MFFRYMYRNLRTRDNVVHNMKSRVRTKVEPVSKLCARKLRLNDRKGTDLKGKRLSSHCWIVIESIVNIKGMNVILHMLRLVPMNR
jgi:hypothetical protein